MRTRVLRHFLANRGDDWAILSKGAASAADALFIDLEDGVHPTRKDAARANVITALTTLDYRGKYRLVRINDLATPVGQADLEVVRARPDAIMLGKVRSPADVKRAEPDIARAEREYGLPVGSTRLFVMLETASAILNAYELLTSSPRIEGAFFGPADLSVDVNCRVIGNGLLEMAPVIETASHLAALAGVAAGVYMIGPVLSSLRDLAQVGAEARRFFDLGFTGCLIITPRHIEAVNAAYRPTPAEAAYAAQVCEAFERGAEQGLGVVALNDQMMEIPFYTMARRTMERASS